MNTLGDELPREIERCEHLLKLYEEIGPAGQFARLMLARSIATARTATHEGDVVSMLRSLQDLRGYE